jgi:hypothetical protein
MKDSRIIKAAQKVRIAAIFVAFLKAQNPTL